MLQKNISTKKPENKEIKDLIVSTEGVTSPKSPLCDKHTPIETPTDYLTGLAKGMSREELEIISEQMPIELCFNRIGKEIQKTKEFAKAIKSAIDIYDGK